MVADTRRVALWGGRGGGRGRVVKIIQSLKWRGFQRNIGLENVAGLYSLQIV